MCVCVCPSVYWVCVLCLLGVCGSRAHHGASLPLSFAQQAVDVDGLAVLGGQQLPQTLQSPHPVARRWMVESTRTHTHTQVIHGLLKLGKAIYLEAFLIICVEILFPSRQQSINRNMVYL